MSRPLDVPDTAVQGQPRKEPEAFPASESPDLLAERHRLQTQLSEQVVEHASTLAERDRLRVEVERLRVEVPKCAICGKPAACLGPVRHSPRSRLRLRQLLPPHVGLIHKSELAGIERQQELEEQRDALADQLTRTREETNARISDLSGDVERLQERVAVDEARIRAFHRELIAAGYPGAEPFRVGELREQRDALADALLRVHGDPEDPAVDQLRKQGIDLPPPEWLDEVRAALRKAGRLL